MNWATEDETEEDRHNEEPRQQQISLFKIGTVISIAVFVGVFFANIASTEVSKAILKSEIEELAREASEQLRIATEQRKQKNIKREELRVQQRIQDNRIRQQQSIAQAEQNRINRIERERQSNANKKRIETCRFWQDQYRKTGKKTDKNHRDNACRAAGIN